MREPTGREARRRSITPPEPLAAAHDLTAFDNGRHPELDGWLRDRARTSEGLSARTYVVATKDEARQVVGYYAISASMADIATLPSAKLRRNMPAQVPFILVGRLAVDRSYQGLGLGGDLLEHAFRMIVEIAERGGVRGAATSAIDERAAAFYRSRGFRPSALDDRMMMIPIEHIRSLLLPAS